MQPKMNEYENAIKDGPAPALRVALDLAGSGKTDQARRLLERIVRSFPNFDKAVGHLGWLWLNRGNPERALPLYRRLAEKYPDSVGCQVMFARALAETGKPRRADQIADSIDPSGLDASYLDQLAVTYVWTRRWERALELFNALKARDSNREGVDGRIRLLQILMRSGKKGDFRQRLRRAKSYLADPGPPRSPFVILAVAPRLAVDLGYPPIGLASLAAGLTHHGFPVRIVDANLEIYSSVRADWRVLWNQEARLLWTDRTLLANFGPYITGTADKISASPARLIGFSVFDNNRMCSMEMARRIREQSPEKTIVFGGPDCFPVSRCASRFPDDIVDGFVIGEGEHTVVEIAKRVRDGQPLDGVPGFWPAGSSIEGYRSVEQAVPLSSLELPTYDEFKIALQPGRTFFLELTRGCTGRCDFCNDRQMWPGFRSRSPDEVVAQMKRLIRKHGARHFSFVDTFVNARVSVLRDFCRQVIAEGISTDLSAAAKISHQMDPETYREMQRAGFKSLSYGIESGSDTVLQAMGKGFTAAEAEQFLGMTRDAGIHTGVFLMVGHPAEGEKEFQETLDFLRRNREVIFTVEAVNMCQFIEGTDLFERANRYGVMDPLNPPAWKSDNGNTVEVRKKRRDILLDLIDELGFKTGFPLTKEAREADR